MGQSACLYLMICPKCRKELHDSGLTDFPSGLLSSALYRWLDNLPKIFFQSMNSLFCGPTALFLFTLSLLRPKCFQLSLDPLWYHVWPNFLHYVDSLGREYHSCVSLLEFFFFFLIFFFWLCWVFVSVWGLSPVAASGGHSSSWCAGLSLLWPLLLRSTGSRRAGSVVVARGLSCSAACGIFPDQGSNPCPLHQQADSQPLRHQGSP